MADRRYRPLLGIAAALAFVRFVVVPWLDAQSEARERLQVMTQRLDRSTGVVQNREAIVAAAQELEAAAATARSRFPEADSVESFRLEGQRRIGGMVNAAGLKLAMFDWVLEGAVEEGGLAYGRARFQVEGALRDVARLHGEMEGSLPAMSLRELQLNVSSPAASLGETNATLIVVADFFYRTREPS